MGDTLILQTPEETGPFLNEICRAADANRHELGFLPSAVYQEAVERAQIWVVSRRDTYCGHLFFGGARPTLKIKQLYIMPEWRGRGFARRLIGSLVETAEQRGYGSIRARVAEDLEANAAWERLGFEQVDVVPGGRTTGRRLLVRFRRLMPRSAQQHFLERLDRISTELDHIRALGLPVNRTECYTLDVNVWLDFTRSRQPHADAARTLVQQAAANQLRLRITDELHREAERTAAGRASDPLLDFALSWPTLSGRDDERVATLAADLRALVFPDRSIDGRRAVQDESDLRHLAISILNGATGFVTREKALLRAHEAIFSRYDFQIVAPIDLLEAQVIEPPAVTVGPEGAAFKLDAIAADRPGASALIAQVFGGHPTRDPHLDVECDGIACALDGVVVGVIHWPRSTARAPEAHLAIAGPARLSHERRQRVFDVLIGWLVSHTRPETGATRILLQVDAQTGETFTHDLERAGFFPTSRANDFVRFVLAPPTRACTWSDIASSIEREFAARATWLGDRAEGPVLRLQHEEGQRHFDRFAFESSFGLTRETIADRVAWYVPIRPELRDELLPLARQGAFFRRYDASWRVERAYFRSPTRPYPAPGDILLFYVSQPVRAVVGLARCTVSRAFTVAEARERFARQAVIDPADAASNDRVHGMAFDNYVPVPNGLRIGRLRSLAAWPAQSILSTVRLPTTCPLVDLLDAAFG